MNILLFLSLSRLRDKLRMTQIELSVDFTLTLPLERQDKAGIQVYKLLLLSLSQIKISSFVFNFYS